MVFKIEQSWVERNFKNRTILYLEILIFPYDEVQSTNKHQQDLSSLQRIMFPANINCQSIAREISQENQVIIWSIKIFSHSLIIISSQQVQKITDTTRTSGIQTGLKVSGFGANVEGRMYSCFSLGLLRVSTVVLATIYIFFLSTKIKSNWLESVNVKTEKTR